MKTQGNRMWLPEQGLLGDDNPTASSQGTGQSRGWQRLDMRGQTDKNQHPKLRMDGTLCFLKLKDSSKSRLPVVSRTMVWDSPRLSHFLCLLWCCKVSFHSLCSLHRFSVHMEEYVLVLLPATNRLTHWLSVTTPNLQEKTVIDPAYVMSNHLGPIAYRRGMQQ